MTYTTTTERLAAEVRAQMGRGRTSLAALADTSGISESTLKRRLSGNSDFTVREVELIASALEVKPIDLLVPAYAEAVA